MRQHTAPAIEKPRIARGFHVATACGGVAAPQGTAHLRHFCVSFRVSWFPRLSLLSLLLPHEISASCMSPVADYFPQSIVRPPVSEKVPEFRPKGFTPAVPIDNVDQPAPTRIVRDSISPNELRKL